MYLSVLVMHGYWLDVLMHVLHGILSQCPWLRDHLPLRYSFTVNIRLRWPSAHVLIHLYPMSLEHRVLLALLAVLCC